MNHGGIVSVLRRSAPVLGRSEVGKPTVGDHPTWRGNGLGCCGRGRPHSARECLGVRPPVP